MLYYQKRKDRRRKIRQRKKHPLDFDSDDSFSTIFTKDAPRIMFGNPGKYQIPDLDRVKQYLKSNSKFGLEQLVEQIFPPTRPLHIKYKALSIMYHEQMISDEMIKAIEQQDDRIGAYINFLNNRSKKRGADRGASGPRSASKVIEGEGGSHGDGSK